MVSVEHSGDIMQGITLLISVPDNRFLFWRVVNPSSSVHGNVPLIKIALHRPAKLTASSGRWHDYRHRGDSYRIHPGSVQHESGTEDI